MNEAGNWPQLESKGSGLTDGCRRDCGLLQGVDGHTPREQA
jgi:hypothetical protein